MKRLFSLLSVFLLAGCSVFGIRGQTGEPKFTIVDQVGDIEIRQYRTRLAADAIVTGDEDTAINEGFRILADYIFGNNSFSREISMTAPVEQRSETIAMTAPVAQEQLEDGKWRIRFYMPEDYTLETLPRPGSSDVEIVTVPAETYAVLRFSGRRDSVSFSEKRDLLLSHLNSSGWHQAGSVKNWYFDPPWTLPWFRRNEVAIEVARN